MLKRKVLEPWVNRAGRISLEITALVAAVICAGWVVTGQGATADIYVCVCNNGPLTSADILTHQPCQTGAEQDADCVLWALNNGSTHFVGAHGGCGTQGLTIPTDATALQNLKNKLIQLGYDPAIVNGAGFAGLFDGKCNCYDCVWNTTQNVAGNTQNSPCEGLVIFYGAYCERDQTGTCNLNPPVDGVVRESLPPALKPGKTACSGAAGVAPGSGSTTVTYCGRGSFNTDGTQRPLTFEGPKCADDGTNCTTNGAARFQIQGKVASCKT
jgi:hypothetical protein